MFSRCPAILNTLRTVDTLDAARQFYEDEARRLEGRRVLVLAEALEQRAVEVRLQGLRSGRHEATHVVLEQEEVAWAAYGDQYACHLARAADELRQAFQESNPAIADLGPGIVGQAHLGVAESESIDPHAIQGEGASSFIDTEMAKGVAAHETFHTEQQAPDVPSIEVGGTEVTADEFIEAGAIAAQAKTAPGSVAKLSAEYQELYGKVLTLLPDRDRVQELSRVGDFGAFGEEAGEYRNAA